eukprot:TRINITY_DN36453_c0_g1_i1.p2 TRINITY_DN36453_c0_g1~~TRINITY_DN36453_c0_g1_i1.p2  ORF type:complete len:280 (+),score=82.86 TRINITY_DN36453_c0_g1_i1:71-910(+)
MFARASRRVASTAAAAAIAGRRVATLRPRATATWRVQLRGCAEPARIIHMEHTPNPDSMKFSQDDDQLFAPEGVTLDFASARTADKSPLAKTLFEVQGVKSVFIASMWITVTKNEDVEWEELEGLVMEKIRAFLASGEPVLPEDFEAGEDTKIHEDDPEEVQAIKELISSRIRPMVQGDGGDVKYIGFEDGVVLLLMQGACQSCPSSGATLKGGIERMLMHWIPEVIEVRAVDEEFAEEYLLEQEEVRKRYKRDPKTGKLTPRESPEVTDTKDHDMNAT